VQGGGGLAEVCPAVNLNVMLAVLAQALTAALRARLPGYAAATPDTIQRRFLETPGQITTDRSTITVRLERRAFSETTLQHALLAFLRYRGIAVRLG